MEALEPPYYYPFSFTYKDIVERPNSPPRPKYHRDTSLNTPQVIAGGFQIVQWSPTYAWTPEALYISEQEIAKSLATHCTSSIFWCSDHETFLTVPYDCTVTNVKDKAKEDELDNWERLKFSYDKLHSNFGNQCVSVVGHRYPENKLAAMGPVSWVPQLIPGEHQRWDPPAVLNTSGPTTLAGDLSIVLGLAALSAAVENVVETIQKCFRPGTRNLKWMSHGRATPASTLPAARFVDCTDITLGQHDRGIVMTIKYDPRLVTKAHLEQWEAGTSPKGPILI
jgi:hypothetical protein